MKHKVLELGLYKANAHVFWQPDIKEAIIFDVGGESEVVMAFLNEKELTLKHIFLTHGHVDHIAGVEALKKATQAPVSAHPQEKDMLLDPALNLSKSFPIAPISLTPDRLLEDNQTITWGNETIRVIHTPGHTKGGVCYQLGKWLVSGDTLFKGSIGRTDLYGGSMNTLMQSLKKLTGLSNETIVLAGHGPQSTIGHEKKLNPYINT